MNYCLKLLFTDLIGPIVKRGSVPFQEFTEYIIYNDNNNRSPNNNDNS